MALALGTLGAALAGLATPAAHAAAPAAPAAPAAAPPALSGPLYGVTVDSVTDVSAIAAAAASLPEEPTIRIYFDVKEPASYYAAAIRTLGPVSHLMGELLDSSDSRHITVAAYDKRVKSYVAAFGGDIDVWEIGNEVNGNWTGRYTTVEAKLTEAYDVVAAAGGHSALTLYDNLGCGDGRRELDPLSFSRQYVPSAVRSGLSYVFLSYYEDSCNGIRPGAAAWTTLFGQLHALYPGARVGFGEIGMAEPATGATLGAARSLMAYYYGLDITLPYYVGGYFWWYFTEDCLPTTKPLWSTLVAGFDAEAAVLAH
jgi:hypothetical protein